MHLNVNSAISASVMVDRNATNNLDATKTSKKDLRLKIIRAYRPIVRPTQIGNCWQHSITVCLAGRCTVRFSTGPLMPTVAEERQF
jgi:hypothetical protein